MKDILIKGLMNVASKSKSILTLEFVLEETFSYFIGLCLMSLVGAVVLCRNSLIHKVKSKKDKDVVEEVELKVYENRSRKNTVEVVKQSPWEAYNQSMNLFDEVNGWGKVANKSIIPDEVYGVSEVLKQVVNKPIDSVIELWNVVG